MKRFHPVLFILMGAVVFSVLLFPLTLRTAYGSGDLEIHTIDVGQGASELVIGPNGTTILIDGGASSKGSSEVIPYLNAIFPVGFRHLDYVIASHDDWDHYSGLLSVLSGGYTAGTVYHCGDNADFGLGVQIPLGLVINLGEGAKATCVGRYGQFIDGSSGKTSSNNLSICLLIQYCGFYGRYGGFDYITAGDLDSNEDCLSNALITYPPGDPYLDPAYGVDVIHVNHHGSDASSSATYVNRLKAELSVINGGTDYGHPRWTAVDRLKGRKYYSDGSGATGVTWMGGDVFRTTYKDVDTGRAPEWDCPTLGDMVITYDGCSSYFYLNGSPYLVDNPCITPSPTPEGFKTPTPTPTPPPTPSTTPTITPTPSVTPTPEGFKTPSPTPTVTPTLTPPPTATPPVVSLPFYDGFELGHDWHWLFDLEAESRVMIATYYYYAGKYSAMLDDWYDNSTYSTTAMILPVDLSSYCGSEVFLEFYWREFDDEDDPEDGVFVSDDYGGSWDQVFSFNNGPQDFTHKSISLSEMQTVYGFDFNDHFQVKFQFYDNASIPTDGYAIDEVRIWAVTPPPSPTATLTPTPTPTPSLTPTPTPFGYTTPTPTPSAIPTPSVTPSFSVTPTPTITPEISSSAWITDFNGDGTSDIAIFRESSGLWAVRGITRAYFGSSGDEITPGDYDGDGTTDIGLYRPGSGMWAVREVTRAYFGSSSDLPYPGDYDGDGTWDVGLYRPSSGLWAVKGVTRAYFGGSSDDPAPGYYDGNFSKDIGIFRPATGLWAVRGVTRLYFGGSGDTIVPGDYNGDGTWDYGIFRSTSGLWAVRGVTRSYFGGTSDDSLPGDYDGDSRDDIGIYRGSSGLWAIKGISRVYYGASGDIPVTR